MSKAAKRERQRLNREARREAEMATARRRRQLKTARNVGLLLLPLVGLFVFLQITRDDEAAAISCDDVEAPAPRTVEPTTAPAMEIVPTTLYTAVLDTSCGKIEILLDTAQAPTEVNNFVFLARQGFYDDTSFHRAAKDFVIQGGDPAGDGSGGPGYEFVGEVPAPGTGYSVGSVAMAKSGDAAAGTSGSQFFIITSQGQGLQTLNTEPYQYGVLGQVSKGLKIAQKIESFAPEGGDGPPTKTIVLKKVTIKET
ncbi:MAG TPA: peptidylprolyl isomerase, partial [Acidimicrobiia bacterium]|nr:peptidylprolyl isomerase [Acidimicrobiia bacterium]